MSFRKRNRECFRNSSFVLFFVCCTIIAVFQVGEAQKIKKELTHSREQDLVASDSLTHQLTVLKSSPSLGFRNLIANSVFLSFLQYFSDVSEQTEISEHLSPDFFDTIITFEPFYRDYYLFLSESTTFYAAEPEKSVELMNRGLKQIDPALVSDSFYIWRYKGVDELLFLNDVQSATESFRNAALWAQQSDRPDSNIVGKVSQQTADFLSQDPESRHAQIAAWESVLANAVNEDIRKRAAQRIQELNKIEDTNTHLQP